MNYDKRYVVLLTDLEAAKIIAKKCGMPEPTESVSESDGTTQRNFTLWYWRPYPLSPDDIIDAPVILTVDAEVSKLGSGVTVIERLRTELSKFEFVREVARIFGLPSPHDKEYDPDNESWPRVRRVVGDSNFDIQFSSMEDVDGNLNPPKQWEITIYAPKEGDKE